MPGIQQSSQQDGADCSGTSKRRPSTRSTWRQPESVPARTEQPGTKSSAGGQCHGSLSELWYDNYAIVETRRQRTHNLQCLRYVCDNLLSYLDHILISPDFNLLGLYYKLHGVHRPSGMKKSEIKRRRRVMPATSDQHLAPFSVNNTQPISPPPEPAAQRSVPPFYPPPQQQQQQQKHSDHSHSHQLPPHSFEPARLPRAPIAVDFTHFGKPLRPTSAEQPESAQPSNLPVSRKRSFSISNASDQARQPPSPAYARSDRSQRSEAENIDPSLSSTTPAPGSSTSQEHKVPQAVMGTGDLTPSGQSLRQEKRARLEQEMAMMREALLAKEREMAELSD